MDELDNFIKPKKNNNGKVAVIIVLAIILFLFLSIRLSTQYNTITGSEAVYLSGASAEQQYYMSGWTLIDQMYATSEYGVNATNGSFIVSPDGNVYIANNISILGNLILQNGSIASTTQLNQINTTANIKQLLSAELICYSNGTNCPAAGNIDLSQYYNTSQGRLDNQSWNQTAYWNNASGTFITDGNTNWDNSYGFITGYTETDPYNNRSWNQSVTDSLYLGKTGVQILNGQLVVNGNVSVIGSYVNLTVLQEIINGSVIPAMSNLFDIGSNTNAYNTVYANNLTGSLNASYIMNAPWNLGYQSEAAGWSNNTYNTTTALKVIIGEDPTTELYVNQVLNESLVIHDDNNTDGGLFLGNVNNYYQVRIKNINHGDQSSASIVIENDRNYSENHWVELGCNGQNFAGGIGAYDFPDNCFLNSEADDLILTTGDVTKKILLSVGGGTGPQIEVNSAGAFYGAGEICTATNGLCVGSGNASFNQTLTDSLYYPKNSNPQGYYNITTLPAVGDNTTWNETRANMLFYNKTYIDTLGNWSVYQTGLVNANTTLNTTVTSLITAVNNLQTANQTTNGSVSSLVTAISNLQSANITLNSSFNNHQTTINNLQTANTTLNSTVTSLITSINNLQTANTTLNSSFNNHQTAINNLQSANSTTNGSVMNLITAVNNLQSANITNAGRIDAINNSLITTIYYPTTNLTIYGTNVGGNNIGNLSFIDGQVYNVTESAGVNALEIRINFSGITQNFTNIQTYIWYSGSTSHEQDIDLWDYGTSTWENYLIFTSTPNAVLYNIPVADASNHISGGIVQLRIRHASNGQSGHYLSIDEIQLQKGITIIGNGQVHDPTKTDVSYTQSLGNWSAYQTGLLNANTTLNSTVTSMITSINNLQTSNSTTNASVSALVTAIGNLQTANTTMNSSIATMITNVSNQQLQISSMVNLSLANINSNMGNASKYVANCGVNTVIQNITATGIQCVQDQTSAGGGYSTIMDETTPLTQRSTLIFTGTGVACSDTGSATSCTIDSVGGSWTNGTPINVSTLVIDNGVLNSTFTMKTIPSGITVPTPVAGFGTMYNVKQGGRSMFRVAGPSGMDYNLQPSVYQQNIMMIMPGTTTTVTQWGTSTAISSAGTLSTPAVTSRYGRRTLTTSAATAFQNYSIMSGDTFLVRGENNTPSAGASGWFLFDRVTLENATTAYQGLGVGGNSSIIFVGVTSGTGISMVVNATTLPAGSYAGFYFSNNTAATNYNNWTFITSNGTVPSGITVYNTTLPFRGQTVLDMYQYCSQGCTSIGFRVADQVYGDFYEGITDGATQKLPANSTLLRAGYAAGNVGGVVANMGLQRQYAETDR